MREKNQRNYPPDCQCNENTPPDCQCNETTYQITRAGEEVTAALRMMVALKYTTAFAPLSCCDICSMHANTSAR